MAGVDNETDGPVCVPQRATSKEKVLGAEGNLLLLVVESVRALELVDLVVGHLALEVALEAFKVVVRLLHLLVEVLVGDLVLEVGLSIQVLGLDVAQALALAALAQHHVRREELIAVHLHDVPYLDLLPGALLEVGGLLIVDESFLRVFLVVALMSLVVLEYVLDHAEHDDDREGEGLRGVPVGDGDDRDHLHDGDEDEVDVRHLAELLYQILRQEVQLRVL